MPDTSSFKYHMEKHQTEKRHSFKCDECGLLVSSSVCLKRHKDLKHPIGGSHDYTCHICNRVSPTLRALNKHIKCAHEMGYDYKCTLCEKAFKRSDNLKVICYCIRYPQTTIQLMAFLLQAHMSTHTGTPLFRCSWCPKEFYSNGNMYMHRKKAHPAEWEEEKRKRYSGNFPPNSKSTNAPNSVNLSE